MGDPRMENYNYWHDSRVQAAMFSSCWEIVHQESDSSVVSFDDEWVFEHLVWDKVEELARKWVEDEEDFTQAYRDLRAAAQEVMDIHDIARKATLDEHDNTFWKVPSDEKMRLNALFQDAQNAKSPANDEFEKLYERAKSENPPENILKEMGFEMFRRKDGEEFPCCMRVRSKFEVCSQCSGSGKVVRPEIDCGGLSQEDFYDDPDFEEAYFSGRYDVTCPTCHGKRVEAIPQFPEWLNEEIESYEQDQWDSIQESCAERAMGA